MSQWFDLATADFRIIRAQKIKHHPFKIDASLTAIICIFFTNHDLVASLS